MADDETRELLKRNLKLAEENNRLLRGIRRSMRTGTILRLLWWVLILGVPVYLYFAFVEPYLASLGETYADFKTNLELLQQVPEPLQGFLEKLPQTD